ncbi:MAG: Hsp70 family protein [Nitrospirae bacterium]|nr:Hsp70 family protein [Nitrospirota bacterium]
MDGVIVGIDLGTTNSEVAVVRDGRVEVIPVSGNSRILPSVVGIGDSGTLLVGEAARNQYILHPERTVRSIKRRMGEFGKVAMGENQYTPQEISAMILARLKQAAEAHLGQTVGKAVITVPAFFSDAQRQATREAGEIAGLEVVRILNEPTAAALSYEKRLDSARKLLVYDLGGGTFDVSIVNIEGEVVEVLASHGNNHLGGDDFDRKIVDRALEHLEGLHKTDFRGMPTVMARLQRAAEEAKIALSSAPFVTLSEEYLSEKDGVPVHLSLEISRTDYEEMIGDYIDETMNAVHIAIRNARLSVSEIDEILLVGGSTRTPLIVRRLTEDLGKVPRFEVDPDLCVAMGAAIQASLIAGTGAPRVLVDVTPYTFGISVLGYLPDGMEYPKCFAPLIRKNSPIPVSKSEVFTTSHDGQTEVEITVYQGEHPDALENIEIGQFLVTGLRPLPQGENLVIVSFSLDLDGLLRVTAREKETGLECSIDIERTIAPLGQEELDRSRERIVGLIGEGSGKFAEGAAPGSSALSERIRSLRERADRLLAGSLDGEDREDLIERVSGMIDQADGPEEELLKAAGDLEDLLFYLEA